MTSRSNAPSTKARVLVVEDDEDLRLGLVLWMKLLDYEVAEAGDGQSAVKAVMDDPPDVMLLDLGLPRGDGVWVLQCLEDEGVLDAVPVIVFTGRDPRRAAVAVAPFHVRAVFQKPADNAALAQTIAEALRGPQSPPEPPDPLRRPAPGPPERRTTTPQPDERGSEARAHLSHLSRPIRILLVEDSPADRAMTSAALRGGRVLHELSTASDGEVAMAYLRREGRFANAPRPDLVILDLNLPRKDGREVLAEIKADDQLKAIPVIVLTTSSSEADVAGMYQLQAAGYVTKPLDFDAFVAAVRGIEDFWLVLVRLPMN